LAFSDFSVEFTPVSVYFTTISLAKTHRYFTFTCALATGQGNIYIFLYRTANLMTLLRKTAQKCRVDERRLEIEVQTATEIEAE